MNNQEGTTLDWGIHYFWSCYERKKNKLQKFCCKRKTWFFKSPEHKAKKAIHSKSSNLKWLNVPEMLQ